MKYALVTGGSRGIGRAISLKLAEMGFYVLINYTSNEEQAKITLDSIVKNGGFGEILRFDVSKKEQVEEALNTWKEKNKEAYIEIVVNNAGINKDTLMMWMEDADWKNVLNISLDGFFFVTRNLLKEMLVKRKGRIINIVSLSGLKGVAGQVNYSTAKAGIIGATRSLAQETAKRNVTVNAVAPGFIRSDMTAELDEKQLKSLIPMNRFGEPEEVAEVVAFLASDKAAYITGEVISVNGGLY
ncbi:MAG TPA: 3-oxoacyl-ACP reductase FabG [Cytophagales bacterium]|nr:3-oxoacyl-ACP reductase FabG [Cytophagales bacterium]